MSFDIGMGNVQAWDIILAWFWKLGQAFRVETNEPVWKYLTNLNNKKIKEPTLNHPFFEKTHHNFILDFSIFFLKNQGFYNYENFPKAKNPRL
jgi:hypothetical protein